MTDFSKPYERRLKEPWQLTKEEWDRERESCRANTAQSKFTRASGAEAVRRFEKLQWLCYGLGYPDRNVTWHDVRGKASSEGKIAQCAHCATEVETPLPEGWVWDCAENKHWAWCPECANWIDGDAA